MKYVCQYVPSVPGHSLARAVEELLNEPQVVDVVGVSVFTNQRTGGKSALVTLRVNEAGD